MGRPKDSSWIAYNKIYQIVRWKPISLAEWKTTGIKCRTVAHKRLNYLVSIGLLEKTRQGHKILYQMPVIDRYGLSGYGDKSEVHIPKKSWAEVLKPEDYSKQWEKLYAALKEKPRTKGRGKLRWKGDGQGVVSAAILWWQQHGNDPQILWLEKCLGIEHQPNLFLFENYPLYDKILTGDLCPECLEKGKAVTFIDRGEEVCPDCGHLKEY
jgi:hypothetical protein